MSALLVRDLLWPELPLMLRVMVRARLQLWARMYASAPCSAEDFALALLREGYSLRGARDLLWREVADDDARRNPEAEFPWPPPDGPLVLPDAKAELQRVLADTVAELPPELAKLPAFLLEGLVSRELGFEFATEDYVEWICSTGLTPDTLRIILLGEIRELAGYDVAHRYAAALALTSDVPEPAAGKTLAQESTHGR
jgi:hypothetical protein